MKKKTLVLVMAVICLSSTVLLAGTLLFRKAKVDFESYEKLVTEVREHRKARLITVEEFNKMSKEKNVIILDARSDRMFESKHIKGAKHLNFCDFTQSNLARIIPDTDTKVLIYCNNNFESDEINFASKAYVPRPTEKSKQELTLALNIPLYINLYGYGYKNVYELSELVNVFDGRMEYEGTAVRKL
jgi:Rhodanese-like domain